MMLREPSIGVVIVSLNTRELLRACLQSLDLCTLPLTIVVVDNGSSDGSVAMVRADFPYVRLLEPGDNIGFGRGNNAGIRELKLTKDKQLSSFVLLLNPDTIVHSGAIEELVCFLQAHPRVGLVSPRLLHPNGTIQPAAFRFPTLTMALLDLFPPGEVLPGRLYGSWWHGRYAEETTDHRPPFPIDHPLGACMLVRGEALEQVHGFDERYFMYSEEIDFCWRIRKASWAIWQVPQARVTHYGGAATSQFRQRMFVELYRSRAQFAAQHYSQVYTFLHRLIVRAGMLRATLRSWNDYRMQRIDRNELRARLWSYALVSRS